MTQDEAEIRDNALRETIAGLNLDNFIVRRKRRAVEKYQADGAWAAIDDAAREELIEEIAPAMPGTKGVGNR